MEADRWDVCAHMCEMLTWVCIIVHMQVRFVHFEFHLSMKPLLPQRETK